ncbi:hypothetical protein L6164_028250 [Bauhinia variegata]|uniref:Uncharacterized protein n=1 Tax=Bauhinia variegata TaxID=167791 RepID=A0ACB9LVW6_BAUVA|nr:hypothetical protein L6164_028250 [Bauhinia variegata]
MGGCCCCSSKGTELNGPPSYFYYPRASDERVPLSPHQAAASAFSGGLLVDTNLDTSIPDTYRPPPAPIPFNATFIVSQTPPAAQEIYGNKTNGSPRSTNSNSVQETVSGDNHGTVAKLEELKESESKIEVDLELDPAKGSEIQLPKLAEPIISEEDDGCPICLEEYDAENPKLTAKCDHHFHLACILEWMERSEACPVCDQAMVFNPPIEL